MKGDVVPVAEPMPLDEQQAILAAEIGAALTSAQVPPRHRGAPQGGVVLHDLGGPMSRVVDDLQSPRREEGLPTDGLVVPLSAVFHDEPPVVAAGLLAGV